MTRCRPPSLLILTALALCACAPAATAPSAAPSAAAAPSAPTVALSAGDRQPLPKPGGAISLPIAAGPAFAGKNWSLTRLDDGSTLAQGQADGQGQFAPTLSAELATIPAKLVAAGAGIAAGKVLVGGVVGGVLSANGAWLQSSQVISAGGGAVISAGGGAVISAGGGAVISAGGGAVVSAGGGALSHLDGYRLAQTQGSDIGLAAFLTPPSRPVGITPAELFAARAQEIPLRHLAQNQAAGGAPAVSLALAQNALDALARAFAQDFESLPNAAELVGASLEGPMPPALMGIVQQRQSEIERATTQTGQATVLGASMNGAPLPPDIPPFTFGPVAIAPPPVAELLAALPPVAQLAPEALPQAPAPGPAAPGEVLPGPAAPPPPAPLPPAPAPAGGGGASASDSDPVPFFPAASPGVALSGPFTPPTQSGMGSLAQSLSFGWAGFQSLPNAFALVDKPRALVLQHGASSDRSLFVLGNAARLMGGQMLVPVWRAPILAQGALGAFVLAGGAPPACAQGSFVGEGANANVVGCDATDPQYHVAAVDGAGNISFTSPAGALLHVPVLNPACGRVGAQLVVAGGQNAMNNDVATIQSVPLVGGEASAAASLAGNLHVAASGGRLVAHGSLVAWPNPISVDGTDSPRSLVLVPALAGSFSSNEGPARANSGSDAALLSVGATRLILLAGGSTQPAPEAMVLADAPGTWTVVPAGQLRYAWDRKDGALASQDDRVYLVGGRLSSGVGLSLGAVEFGRLLP